MENILVVDDDEEIRKLIKDFLEKEKYSVDTAKNGQTALEIISKNPLKYRLIVLDVMLPDVSGSDVCRQIRKFSAVPIIMLTAKSDDEDKISGLEMGADDYITKPFNPKELVARIKASIRRSYSLAFNPGSVPAAPIMDSNLSLNEIYKIADKAQEPDLITLFFKKSTTLKSIVVDKLIDQISQKLSSGARKIENKRKKSESPDLIKIEIYPKSRKLFVNSEETRLTKKEFNILLYFVKNKNIVISREKLLEDIWGYDFIGQSRTIDVHIKELRKKIMDLNGNLIETIWAVGYRFNIDSSINKI